MEKNESVHGVVGALVCSVRGGLVVCLGLYFMLRLGL